MSFSSASPTSLAKPIFLLRATCKHLEQLTRKRFAAAYITAACSPASFAGLDQLDQTVSRSYSRAVMQGWMAVGDVPVYLGFAGFETPLRKIFQKMTQHTRGLDVGIVLPTGPGKGHYHGEVRAEHKRTIDFRIMMLNALPNLSYVRSFSVDAWWTSEPGSLLAMDLRRIVQGVLSSQAPGATNDFTIRLHDLAMFRTPWSEMAVTKDGTCLTFKGVHRRALIPKIVQTCQDLMAVRKLYVIDCTMYNIDLRSLTKSVSSPGWHLDFEDLFFRTHNDRSLFVQHLQRALLHWSQGLHSCRLTNLRSYENGSKLIRDFEAIGIDNIRKHTQSRDFLEYESEEDKIGE